MNGLSESELLKGVLKRGLTPFKENEETAALSRPRSHRNPAAMEFDEVLDDGQAQASAA